MSPALRHAVTRRFFDRRRAGGGAGPSALIQAASGLLFFEGWPEAPPTDVNGLRSWQVSRGAGTLLRDDGSWAGSLNPSIGLAVEKPVVVTMTQGIMVSGCVKGQFQGVYAGHYTGVDHWSNNGLGYACSQRDNFNDMVGEKDGIPVVAGGTDPTNAWSECRVYVKGNDTQKLWRGYFINTTGQAQFTGGLFAAAFAEQVDNSPTTDAQFTHAGHFSTDGGSDKALGDVHACKGEILTVNGLPDGYKVKVDAQALSGASSGGVLSLVVATYGVNSNGFLGDTIEIYTDADVATGVSVSPANGINGGDVYTAS